jgi:hypothetical protein
MTPIESGRNELSANCNGNFIDVQLVVGFAAPAMAVTMSLGGPPASANHHWPDSGCNRLNGSVHVILS